MVGLLSRRECKNRISCDTVVHTVHAVESCLHCCGRVGNIATHLTVDNPYFHAGLFQSEPKQEESEVGGWLVGIGRGNFRVAVGYKYSNPIGRPVGAMGAPYPTGP